MSAEDKHRMLFEAISSGDMPRVIDIVEEDGFDLSASPDVLFFAILTSHADCVHYLLSKGATPHAYTAVEGEMKVTIPLLFFAFPNIAKCELLRNAGCDVNERSSVDGSLLIEYFRRNLLCDSKAQQYLAEQKYDFQAIQQCNEITTDVLSSVFQYMITNQKTLNVGDVILTLQNLQKHMDLNSDLSHNTLMRNIIHNSNLSSLFGALIAVSDLCNIHQNILSIAQVKEITRACKLRLAVSDVALLLKVAITTDNLDLVRYLTECKFNIFAVNINDTHNLITACVHANASKILDYVLGLAFAIDKLEEEHEVIREDATPAVKRLGYTRELQGCSIVHWNPLVVAACSKCAPEVLEMLLDAGFHPTDRELENMIPYVYLCAFMKRWDQVQVLVDAGQVDVNMEITSHQVIQIAQLPTMSIPMDFIACQTKTLAALALTDKRPDVLEYFIEKDAVLPQFIGKKPIREYIRDMKQDTLKQNEELKKLQEEQRRQRIQQEIYTTQKQKFGSYTHYTPFTKTQGLMSTILTRSARLIKLFK